MQSSRDDGVVQITDLHHWLSGENNPVDVALLGCVAIAKVRGVIAMLPDVAEVSPEALNESVDVPAPESARFEKVATPATAFTVIVPESVPGPPATLAVTAAVELATKVLFESRTCTTGCEAKTTPDGDVPLGCVATASCLGTDGGVTTTLVAASEPPPHALSMVADATAVTTANTVRRLATFTGWNEKCSILPRAREGVQRQM